VNYENTAITLVQWQNTLVQRVGTIGVEKLGIYVISSRQTNKSFPLLFLPATISGQFNKSKMTEEVSTERGV
jgi:hypothetical protein